MKRLLAAVILGAGLPACAPAQPAPRGGCFDHEAEFPALVGGSPEAARAAYDAGVAAGDYRFAHATVGEAVGLVHDVPDAATVLQQMHTEAQQRLGER